MKIVAGTFTLLLSATLCFGSWAKHEVVSTSSKEYRVSILPAPANLKELDIVLAPVPGSISKEGESSEKGYFLIKTTLRRKSEALDFGRVLSQWGTLKMLNKKAGLKGDVPISKYVPESLEGIESISQVQPSFVDGHPAIAVQLTPETAMRSYIVYDSISLYEYGALYLDGGLTLTYDLPSLTEAAGMEPKQAPEPK